MKYNKHIISTIGGGRTGLLAVALLSLILLFLLLFLHFFAKPTSASIPIDVDALCFHDHDTYLSYAERAFLDDDPEGLYVLGAAYYLRQEGLLPDEIYTVSHAEADEFLDVSSAQGYDPARTLIFWLQSQGKWQFSNEK